jgi:hypothetical protein
MIIHLPNSQYPGFLRANASAAVMAAMPATNRPAICHIDYLF